MYLKDLIEDYVNQDKEVIITITRNKVIIEVDYDVICLPKSKVDIDDLKAYVYGFNRFNTEQIILKDVE
ncbi:hypothetical protein qdsa001_190 [Staphylococcus phage qdsa001]|nr:hypothetical protein qdsa001_190 [Staphylococcus phage qdsa001]QXV86203.1 hypothetical protein [Staphylococcus phage SAPYZU_15]UVD42372.1 hypothetical protein [Staphylococcus phage vB_SauM-V1SA19]